MELRQRIRERIASGALPASKPPSAVWNMVRKDDDEEQCGGCHCAVLQNERQIEFEYPGRGTLRLHVACYTIWIAELLGRGWLNVA